MLVNYCLPGITFTLNGCGLLQLLCYLGVFLFAWILLLYCLFVLLLVVGCCLVVDLIVVMIKF